MLLNYETACVTIGFITAITHLSPSFLRSPCAAEVPRGSTCQRWVHFSCRSFRGCSNMLFSLLSHEWSSSLFHDRFTHLYTHYVYAQKHTWEKSTSGDRIFFFLIFPSEMERKGVLPVLPRRAPWQVSPFSTASKAAQSLPYRLTQQHCCMESPRAKTEAIWRLLAWTHKEKRKTFSALPVQCCSHYYCLSYFSSCGTTGLYYWPHCYSRVSLISINNFFF